MKKIIFSAAALLTLSIASAQSKEKQAATKPSPTYIEYTKYAPAKGDTITKQKMKITSVHNVPSGPGGGTAANNAVANNAIAAERKNASKQ